MIRKFALTVAAVAAVAAVATPAAAADVYSIRVSLTGKDRATIQADVRAAAEAVCRRANGDLSMAAVRACVARAEAEAMSKVAQAAQPAQPALI